jgi:tetratricopeptide (TPR) repeat protein
MSDQSLADKFKIKTPKALEFKDRIMVVEPQQDLRLIVMHHLSKLSYKNVVHRANGYEAMEFMKEDPAPISAFIVNMTMPVMGGLEFLSELREQVDLKRSSFLLTMDHVSREKIMLAVESGVDEVLVKPFTYQDINPKLKNSFMKFNNPNNPEQVYELAKALIREENFDSAEKVYGELASHNKQSARPLVGIARIWERRGDQEKALSFLAEAEKRNNQFVHLYSERGKIQVKQGKWDEAISSFQKAIAMSPLNAFRYKEAADALFQVKKYDIAIDLLKKALANELEFPDLYHYLSQANFAVKEYKAAAKYIKTALNKDPDNITYLNQLGISLKELKMPDEAQKIYNQIIKIDPGNAPALYNKSILLFSKGKKDDAIKTLERLIKRHPDFKPGIAKLEEYQKSDAA